LKNLYLRRNRLRELPAEIGSLKNIQSIELDDNPDLSSPPPEIIASGTAAVLSYLQQLQRQDTIRYESKLLIVGEAGTGKTSLLRSLHGE
jgi:internalin A